MRILIISNHYPYENYNDYIFVKQLVDQWAQNGNECVVISPQSITYNVKNKRNNKKYVVENLIGKEYSYPLYSPKFITFSNVPILKKISTFLYEKSVIRTIKKNNIKFDFVYAHFMSQAGAAAYKCYKKFGKPFYIAFGESTFKFQSDYSNKELKKIFSSGSGYIAVSKEMKDRLLSLPLNINPETISIHPNGYNPEKFYKENKLEMRNTLGIKETDFVVIFVGGFTHRKGLKRLNDALISLNNKDIKAIFIGEGPEEVSYPYTLYKGKVMHSEINTYLNASDVFVLPTLNEGSCNAVIEAKACGLPIISSNGKFNDEILNDSHSIRIDPLNIDEIKEAILFLMKSKEQRINMEISALESSQKFKLSRRSKDILEFVQKKLNIEDVQC